jgi:hypothetical protein
MELEMFGEIEGGVIDAGTSSDVVLVAEEVQKSL